MLSKNGSVHRNFEKKINSVYWSCVCICLHFCIITTPCPDSSSSNLLIEPVLLTLYAALERHNNRTVHLYSKHRNELGQILQVTTTYACACRLIPSTMYACKLFLAATNACKLLIRCTHVNLFCHLYDAHMHNEVNLAPP